jgi:hypothetical protein
VQRQGGQLRFLTFKNLYNGYSFKRVLFNYRSSCRKYLANIDETKEYFSHSYFQSIAAQYSNKINQVEATSLLVEANKLLVKPYLNITNKHPDTLCINPQNYISFAPYYWQINNEDPMKKSTVKAVYRDSRSNPFLSERSDKPKLAQLCARIHLLALACILSNDKRYIEYIHKQLNIWFVDPDTRMNPHMIYAQIRPWSGASKGYGIIDCRWLILLFDAIAMLKHKLGYEVEKEITSWLLQFAKWILSSISGLNEILRENNRGSWVDVFLCYIGLAVNKPQMVSCIIEQSLSERPQKQINKIGFQPLELKRYNPVSYSLYNMYPLYYLNNLSLHVNNGNKNHSIIKLLQDAEGGLYHLIKGHEEGEIEHINFCSSNTLNLYYPYSYYQLSNFPCVLPFTCTK